MKKINLIYLILFFLKTIDSQAIELNNQVCVKASASEAHELFIDYKKYHTSPGAAYSLPLEEPFELLKMIEPSVYDPKAEIQGAQNNTKSILSYKNVRIAFKPLNMDASNENHKKVFPRFALLCTSQRESGETYTHQCSLNAAEKKFAISNFRSNLKIFDKDTDCKKQGNGFSTKLVYSMILEGNPTEAEMIRTTFIKSIDNPLKKVFFDKTTSFIFKDQDGFLKSYYTNFYIGLIEKLNN